MFLFPEDIKSRLEFDKILEILSSYCLSDMAKSRAISLGLFNNKDRIRNVLEEVVEYLKGIDQANEMPIFQYEDIQEDLHFLSKEGYVLEIDSIFRINTLIQIIYHIDIYFKKKEHQKSYPKLCAIADQIEIKAGFSEFVYSILEPDGSVKDSASPELARINKQILSKERESIRAFDAVLKSLKSSGALSENGEAYKNGRRVLSVLAEYKRRVKGIIHDESASGKTVFIEPDSVVFINNQVFELYLKRKQEIYQILKSLCDKLRPYVSDLALWQKIVIRMDLIRAKAHYARTYNGVAPVISDEHKISLKGAFHPLLFLKNKEEDIPTIPFDLDLNNENRILLISGPNAGGKSITLKTVGLVIFMCQSGLLIPAQSETEIGLFNKFFADIGDQQSVEDDLSTYSSHLRNMKITLEKCSSKSFIFIDEFGSGTDPKVGGAIAEIILNEIKQKRAFGVITTHYSNLKIYAHHNKGIINGAMHFDKQHLSPSYELVIGKPGSSFAFEIAEKIGLDNNLIKKAKSKFGKQHKEVESLLTDLMAEKQALNKAKDALKHKELMVDKLMQNYDKMKQDLDIRRKRIKLNEKEKSLQTNRGADRDIQKLIKEIRESQNLEEAKGLSKQLKEEKELLQSEIKPILSDINDYDGFDPKTLKVGDFVKMKNGNQTAQIKKISKNKVELEMGSLSVTAKVSDLLPASKPIKTNARKSVKIDLASSAVNAESNLDIRGYTPSDAREFVIEFVDQALIANLSRLKIVHGIGSGVLRKLVRQILKEYTDISKVWHPEEEFGGVGVTYIEL